MTRVRIYTENVRYAETTTLARKHFPRGFTVTNARGYWGETEENSLIFEVLSGDCEIDSAVQAFCFDVNKQNKQECCLCTREIVDGFTL